MGIKGLGVESLEFKTTSLIGVKSEDVKIGLYMASYISTYTSDCKIRTFKEPPSRNR